MSNPPARSRDHRVGFTKSLDGTVFVTLTLFPDELADAFCTLSGLAGAARDACDSFKRGDTRDEVALAHLILDNLAVALASAAEGR